MAKSIGRPVTNKHKVPKKQWDRWNPQARKTFNAMYRSMRPSMQFAFMHLGATPMPREYWETTRWNASWEAACIVNGQGSLGRVVSA